ncbi:MAG: ATP-binding protein [Candidatus Methanomethylophilaceae archaeon]|nr:ATP-binding protein [Candidatus Methanomethylophilaceae archaeon]
MSDSVAEGFFHDYIRPGVRHIFDGTTGSGKTHSVISIIQALVEGRYPSVGKVVVLTNIVMVRKSPSGKIEVGYPDKVKPISTMAQMLKLTGKILEEYGMGKVTIILAMDEAQNYMLADQNGAAENQAMVKFVANIRKFGICAFFLTPTYRNLAPKIRNFPDDEKPGNCNVLWRKDLKSAMSDYDESIARSISMVKLDSYEAEYEPFYVESTSWTKPIESLKPGEYSYDTLSAADFSMGTNKDGKEFEIKDFLSFCSGKFSEEIPVAIKEYFETWEGEEDTLGASKAMKEDIRYLVGCADRGKDRYNLPVRTMAEILDISPSTLNAYQHKIHELDKNQQASSLSNVLNGAPQGRDIYNLRGKEAREENSATEKNEEEVES